MKKFVNVFFYAVAALYPVLIFALLVVLKLPVRILSLCIVVVACAFFLSATGRVRNADGKGRGTAESEKRSFDWKPLAQSALFLAAGLFCFFTNRIVFLKLY